jgi:hypothetical protein
MIFKKKPLGDLFSLARVSINGVINAKNMLIVGGKSKFSYLARLSSGVALKDH